MPKEREYDTKIAIRVPLWLADLLKVEAQELSMSLSAFVRLTMIEELEPWALIPPPVEDEIDTDKYIYNPFAGRT